MTNINFNMCFKAELQFAEPDESSGYPRLLKLNDNVIGRIDIDGNPVPDLDDKGNPIKDENGNLIISAPRDLTAKETIDTLIKLCDVLKDAGLFESTLSTDDGKIFEYEANLFDFTEDYTDVKSEADSFILALENMYSNVRAYTIGKYVAGKSFGIKLVVVIF